MVQIRRVSRAHVNDKPALSRPLRIDRASGVVQMTSVAYETHGFTVTTTAHPGDPLKQLPVSSIRPVRHSLSNGVRSAMTGIPRSVRLLRLSEQHYAFVRPCGLTLAQLPFSSGTCRHECPAAPAQSRARRFRCPVAKRRPGLHRFGWGRRLRSLAWFSGI